MHGDVGEEEQVQTQLPAPGHLLLGGRHHRHHEQVVQPHQQGVGVQGRGLAMPVDRLFDEAQPAEQVAELAARLPVVGLQLGDADQAGNGVALAAHQAQPWAKGVPGAPLGRILLNGGLEAADRGGGLLGGGGLHRGGYRGRSARLGFGQHRSQAAIGRG
jgi:hypothetical protein